MKPVEYEELAVAVYQGLLRAEGIENVQVRHNIDLVGRSGVAHQIDVFWEFCQAGVPHRVIVECKHHGLPISLLHVRNLFAVAHDVDARAIIVSTEGFQAGAEAFARYYGIGTKVLRKPRPEDWEGRIRDFHVDIQLVLIDDHIDRRLRIKVLIDTKDVDLANALHERIGRGELVPQLDPTATLVGPDGAPVTPQLGAWIPKQINLIDRAPGGPYSETITTPGAFIVAKSATDVVLVPLGGVTITYYVRVISDELRVLGDQVVQAILKDFASDKIEHVKRI